MSKTFFAQRSLPHYPIQVGVFTSEARAIGEVLTLIQPGEIWKITIPFVERQHIIHMDMDAKVSHWFRTNDTDTDPESITF